jgi:uncharacterized ParB-like nuclease family protein
MQAVTLLGDDPKDTSDDMTDKLAGCPTIGTSRDKQTFHPNKTVTVRLDDLVMDPALQVRRATDPGTVRQYADAMRAGKVFPPIKVADVGGACYLVGGWHRVEAAKAVGLREIEAAVLDAPKEALRWLAAEDNMTHGLPLKRSEARSVFKAYVKAGQHRTPNGGFKSSREIAADLHGMRSHATILEWMRQDFPSIHRAMAGGCETEDRCETAPALEPDPLAPARDLIQQIVARARGVRDPEARGELVAMLERACADVKRAGPWTPYETDF